MTENLVWSREEKPFPDAFEVSIHHDSQIIAISWTVYVRELYRRPGPRHGKAYGRARHRAMKKLRHATAWAAARTIHKDWDHL